MKFFLLLLQTECCILPVMVMPGLGGLDIYRTNPGDQDPNIYNPGYPVNSSGDDFGIVLDATGRQGYLSSNRKNGLGDDDIYELKKFVIPTELTFTDTETGVPVSGKVRIRDERMGKEIPYETLGDKRGFHAVKGRPYFLTMEAESYDFREMEFKTMADSEFVMLDVPHDQNG